MRTSEILAALIGPTLLATAAMLLLNLGVMPAIVEELSRSPMLIVLAGYAAFVPGLAIVYFHNRWAFGWPLFITLIGWLSVIVGLIRMLFPLQLTGIVAGAASSPGLQAALFVVGVVFLIVGGVLSIKAYVRG
ncbi:hypothetical protein [Methylocystis heyeri]|uniref:Uncharacterized protein n=1 Tax=Methylocystis heyeri TaxID=391905 RepID=A0A6B8KEP3_9HYPH|nr:hypothetical protein [Methylocystis heyeri]QGM44913.1 hypothetical protein H2LOC_003990 [Methylocystis heyeri]